MLGALAVLISLILWFLEDKRIVGKTKFYITCIFIVIFVSTLGVFIFAKGELFEILYRLMAREGASPELRGFIPTNIAKIPVAFYSLFFGGATNPGNIPWVFICAAIFGFLFLRGFYEESRKGRFIRTFLLTILPILFLFLILDMIVPKNFPGAEPKYVIFVLPFFLYIVARGCFFKKKLISVLFVCLILIVSVGNLKAYYSGNFNVQTEKLIDLKGLKAFVLKYRAIGAIYYSETPKEQVKFFPWENGAKSFWDLVARWEKREKIVPDQYAGQKILLKINRIYRKDLHFLNSFIETLQKEYVLEDCFHSHGVQAFLFSPARRTYCQVDRNGEVMYPTQFYSLPYDSMDVDRLVQGRGRHFELDAVSNEKSIRIVPGRNAKAIEIEGHLIGCTPTREGQKVGFLVVTDIKGKKKEFVLENGVNVGDWKTDLGNRELSVTQFRKKIMLVGRAAYPDSYKQFNAKVHKSIFDLDGLGELEQLDLKLNSQKGRLVVWGIRLLD
jgi:hypothetical protein